jgi:hypothetical protein
MQKANGGLPFDGNRSLKNNSNKTRPTQAMHEVSVMAFFFLKNIDMYKQLILFLIFLSLNSCYNPYMRINRSAETLSPSQRCTDPIIKAME